MEVKWPERPGEDGEGNKKYKFASVACTDQTCSEIGVQIIAEGGSAVDAMVAVSMALGVCRSVSCGVGGGGFMVYYNKASRKSHIMDYRTTAPGKAHSQMYKDSTLQQMIGGGSMATPGEIAGLWEAHQKFGKLKWSRLIQPAIELAEKGIPLNSYVHWLLKKQFDNVMTGELKALFTDEQTGQMKKVGDLVKMPTLAGTFRRIADEGMDTFYRGSLRDDILADLEEIGDCLLTAEDFENYKVQVREPLTTHIKNGNYDLVSLPPPSGGLVLLHMLKILDGYHFTEESISLQRSHIDSTAKTYHRIIEAWKFAYAARMNLGDDSFVDNSKFQSLALDEAYCASVRARIDDNCTQELSHYGVATDSRLTSGTCQVSILMGNGDAVSFTTTVNSPWGSRRMGQRTGIIFNNEMGDFALPYEPSWTEDAWTAPSNSSNWIEPGKRSLSAMCPVIVLDDQGDVKLVTGGSGGSKITSAASMTVINHLWFGKSLKESISLPRVHHQLLPHTVFYEEGFPQEYLEKLKEKGHMLTLDTFPAVSDSVCKQGDDILGVGDHRRLGRADGF